MKTVEYLGVKYCVPHKAKYMAKDGNGVAYWYENMPQILNASCDIWSPTSGDYDVASLADKSDWSQSLVQL